MRETNGTAFTAISFPVPLALAPTPEVRPNNSPSDTCPGSAEEPTATPGRLCVYLGDNATGVPTVTDPATQATQLARRYGAGLQLAGAGTIRFTGAWAVTAP